jgi:Na+-translocating ferredoxin:NAD+ oxidoreductase RnfC subunit
MKEYRRVPLMQLLRRLQVEEYQRETPCQKVEYSPTVARIRMRQHAGQPAAPVVQERKKMKKGQVVGRVDEGKLGANIHASVDGKVRTVNAGIRRDYGIGRVA